MSDNDAVNIPEWRQIWRTDRGSDECDAYITSTSIDHWVSFEIDLALDSHTMSSILTNSRSARCHDNEEGDVCYCRYKINTCEAGRTTLVYQQGSHVTDDIQTPKPARQRIIPAMKDLIIAELETRPAATTQQLFLLIASEITDTDLQGRAAEAPPMYYSCAIIGRESAYAIV
ncbi:hypothetical protein PI124_g19029 [Phytophthora idaei]|nr:hypothetical protein PI125_g19831 [Phytophthora idaei]KAG3135211.1 hypothetical protein PI126_g18350 [Phytophthora idaei]KAG3235949.1 hypothetical protein PI124_g19029 [Phytophthora idaei]